MDKPIAAMDDLLQVVFSKEQIQSKIDELAGKLNEEYKGQDVVVICVLKGAFLFFTDLVRRLEMNPALDFLRVASYGTGQSSSGCVEMTKDVDVDITDKHVLLVEDVVDSGLSLKFMLERLSCRNPLSIKTIALVDKHERRKVDVVVDYYGFRVEEGFLVGYGMDFAERYREREAIYEVVKQEE